MDETSEESSTESSKSDEDSEGDSNNDNTEKTVIDEDHATDFAIETVAKNGVANTKSNVNESLSEEGARVSESKYDESIYHAETIVKKSVGEFLRFVEASVEEALNHTESIVREGLFHECFGVKQSRFEKAMHSAEAVVKKSVVEFLNFLVYTVEEAVNKNEISVKVKTSEQSEVTADNDHKDWDHVKAVAKQSVADVMDFIETEAKKTVSHTAAIAKESAVELSLSNAEDEIEKTVHHTETMARRIISGLVGFVEARIEEAVLHTETLVKECVVMECVGIAEGKYDEPFYKKDANVKKTVLECLELLEANIEKAVYHAEAIVIENVLEESVTIAKLPQSSNEESTQQTVPILEKYIDDNLNSAEAKLESFPIDVVASLIVAESFVEKTEYPHALKVEQVVNHADYIVFESVAESGTFAEGKVEQISNGMLVLHSIAEDYVGKAESLPVGVEGLITENVEANIFPKINIKQRATHAEVAVLESVVEESVRTVKNNYENSTYQTDSITEKDISKNVNFSEARVEAISSGLVLSSVVEASEEKTEPVSEVVAVCVKENVENSVFPNVWSHDNKVDLDSTEDDSTTHSDTFRTNVAKDFADSTGVKGNINRPIGIKTIVQGAETFTKSTVTGGTVDTSIQLVETKIQSAVEMAERIVSDIAIAIALLVANAENRHSESEFFYDNSKKAGEQATGDNEEFLDQVNDLLLETVTHSNPMQNRVIGKRDIMETVSQAKSAPEMTSSSLKSGLIKAARVTKAVGEDNVNDVAIVGNANNTATELEYNKKAATEVVSWSVFQAKDLAKESTRDIMEPAENAVNTVKTFSVQSFGFSDITEGENESNSEESVKTLCTKDDYRTSMVSTLSDNLDKFSEEKTVKHIKHPSEQYERYIVDFLQMYVNDDNSSSGITVDDDNDDAEVKVHSKDYMKFDACTTGKHIKNPTEQSESYHECVRQMDLTNYNSPSGITIDDDNYIEIEGDSKGHIKDIHMATTNHANAVVELRESPNEVTVNPVKTIIHNFVESGERFIERSSRIYEADIVNNDDRVKTVLKKGMDDFKTVVEPKVSVSDVTLKSVTNDRRTVSSTANNAEISLDEVVSMLSIKDSKREQFTENNALEMAKNSKAATEVIKSILKQAKTQSRVGTVPDLHEISAAAVVGHAKAVSELCVPRTNVVVSESVNRTKSELDKRVDVVDIGIKASERSQEENFEESVGVGNSVVMEALHDNNLHTPLHFNLELQLEATVSQVEAILLKAVDYAKIKSTNTSILVKPTVEKHETKTNAELSDIVLRNEEGSALAHSDTHGQLAPETVVSHITSKSEELYEEAKSSIVDIVDKDNVLRDVDNQQEDITKADNTICSTQENESEGSAAADDGSNKKFIAIVGLETQLNILRELVVYPLLPGEEYVRFRTAAPRGVLLYGRSGTGKTMIGRFISSMFDQLGQEVTVLKLNCTEWMYEHAAMASTLLKEIFAEAKSRQPSIIFLDDINAFTPCRLSQNQFHKSNVTTLVALMKDLGSDTKVKVIATTNHSVDCLDVELLCPGTFERQVYLPLPHLEARKQILNLALKNLEMEMTEEFINETADWTPGYSGSELEWLCVYSQTMSRIRQSLPGIPPNMRNGLQVQRADFVNAAMWLMQQPSQVPFPVDFNGPKYTTPAYEAAIFKVLPDTAPSQQGSPVAGEVTESSPLSNNPFFPLSTDSITNSPIQITCSPRSATPIPLDYSTTVSSATMNTTPVCQLQNSSLGNVASKTIIPTEGKAQYPADNVLVQLPSANSLPHSVYYHLSSDSTKESKMPSTPGGLTQSTPIVSLSSDWVHDTVPSTVWSESTPQSSSSNFSEIGYLKPITDTESTMLYAQSSSISIKTTTQSLVTAYSGIPSIESFSTATPLITVASDRSFQETMGSPAVKTSVLISINSSDENSFSSATTCSQLFANEDDTDFHTPAEFIAMPSLQQVAPVDSSLTGSEIPKEESLCATIDLISSKPTAVARSSFSEAQKELKSTINPDAHQTAGSSSPFLSFSSLAKPLQSPSFTPRFAHPEQPMPNYTNCIAPSETPNFQQMYTSHIFPVLGFPNAAVSSTSHSQCTISQPVYHSPSFNTTATTVATRTPFVTTIVSPSSALSHNTFPSSPSVTQSNLTFSAPSRPNILSTVEELMRTFRLEIPHVQFEGPIILSSMCPNCDYSTGIPSQNQPWVPNNWRPQTFYHTPQNPTRKSVPETLKQWETFDNISGLDKQLNVLRKLVIYPFIPGKAYARFRKTGFRGVLIHGPPGTGKTMTVNVLENECWRYGVKVTCVRLSVKNHSNDHTRCIVSLLRQVFETAKARAPSIIVLEDIDVWANIKSKENEASVMPTFLALADSLGRRSGVILVGTTNRDIESFGRSLFLPGRFERKVYFPLPSYQHRKDILRMSFHNKGIYHVDESVICDVADWTAGYSGADLCHLCNDVLNLTKSGTKDNTQICRSDFLEAILKRTPAKPEPMTCPGQPLSDVGSILLTPARDRILETIYSVFPQGLTGSRITTVKRSNDKFINSNPRILVTGGSGQGLSRYLAPAVLHCLSHLPIYRLDVCQNCSDHVIEKVFSTARATVPSVIYLPYVNRCWDFLSEKSQQRFLELMLEMDYRIPLLVFATTNCSFDQLSNEVADLFLKPQGHVINMTRTPSPLERRQLFRKLFSHVCAGAQNFEKPIMKKLLVATRGAPFKTLRRLMRTMHRRIKSHHYSMSRELFEELKGLIAKFAEDKNGFVPPERAEILINSET